MHITKSKTLFLITVYLILTGFQKEHAPELESDKEQIEKVIIGYIENFFLNEYDKMELFLHERLSKRGVFADGSLSENFSKEDLKTMLSNQNGMPLSMQKNIVSNIFIDQGSVATAVLDTGYPNTRWKEYIHLAKLEGKWIILDVFWCFENIEG